MKSYFKIKATMVMVALVPMGMALSSCIVNYRDFPMDMVGKPPSSKPYETLYYQIKKFPVLDAGGQNALHTVFRREAPFANTEKVDEMPSQGVYCLVDTEWKPLGLPALVFGYISVSTLTLLPAWSVQEGFIRRIPGTPYVMGE